MIYSVKNRKIYFSYGKVMIFDILVRGYLPCFSRALKISSIAKIDSSRMSGMKDVRDRLTSVLSTVAWYGLLIWWGSIRIRQLKDVTDSKRLIDLARVVKAYGIIYKPEDRRTTSSGSTRKRSRCSGPNKNKGPPYMALLDTC